MKKDTKLANRYARPASWPSSLQGVLFVMGILCLGSAIAGQQVLDQVLAKFGGEIVTSLDVRQARMLKLVQSSGDSDQAYVDAIVNRRLMLADLRRNPPPEPTTEAVDAKYREWASRAGGDVSGLLDRAGMTDAGLRAWLRDDLRVQNYVNERFSGRPADITNWIATLRQRAGIQ